MIAAAPVAAAANVQTVVAKIQAFVATAKSAAAGGITWAEFGELFVALIRLAVDALDTLSGVPGAEKKAMAVEAVAMLFDAVADRAVPAVAYPLWLLARPAVRSLVLALAAGAIEQVLPLVRTATA